MRVRAPQALFCAALSGALLFTPARAEVSNPCFTGEGSVKEVIDACAAFIASGSTDNTQLIRAHSVRAMAFSAVGDLDAAVAEMDAAVKIDGTKPNSYFMRAAAYQAKRDYDKAIADLDEAIRLDGKQGDYFLLRGMVYRDKGDLDRALSELNEKVKLDPEASVGYSKRGDIYRQRKEYDLAVADFDHVIKSDAKDAKGYIDRGWVFVLKNDLDRAGADFDKALELQQNDPSALVGRGLVKSRKGQAHRRQRRPCARQAARARHFRRDPEARRRVAHHFVLVNPIRRADSWATSRVMVTSWTWLSRKLAVEMRMNSARAWNSASVRAPV